MKDMASYECYVEARVVVSAPGTLTNAATTNTPDLGRSLGLSVGWETAMNSVVGALIQSERCMRLAVAMALHARLGAESGLAVLGNDVLVLCVPTVVCEPIGTWNMLLNL